MHGAGYREKGKKEKDLSLKNISTYPDASMS
jgi:hypothetical protein